MKRTKDACRTTTVKIILRESYGDELWGLEVDMQLDQDLVG
jgi:hypothetical protein